MERVSCTRTKSEITDGRLGSEKRPNRAERFISSERYCCKTRSRQTTSRTNPIPLGTRTRGEQWPDREIREHKTIQNKTYLTYARNLWVERHVKNRWEHSAKSSVKERPVEQRLPNQQKCSWTITSVEGGVLNFRPLFMFWLKLGLRETKTASTWKTSVVGVC